MRERTIIALWKRLAGGQRLRLRVVSVLVIALGSAALLMGPGMDPTARAQTTVDYDGDDDGLIEVATVAQLNAIRWDLNGDGGVDPGGDATGYSEAFPNAMVSPLMGCAATGCVGYELTANLDLASAGDSVTGWAPIGGASNAFTATFDGGALGFKVSNLTINSSLDRVGLFGETGPGSVIRSVTLEDVRIYGDNFIGALVGRNAGSIIDSNATGNVSGAEDIGGLIGQSVQPGGVIVGSTAGVEVRDTSGGDGFYMGGLVGRNAGPIIDSHATGNVIGAQWVGGLVGENNGAGGVNRISGSTASGTVTGTADGVGGLAGWNNGPISDSHATGDVSGVQWVGGLVGLNFEVGGTYEEGGIYEYGGVNKISGSTASGAVTGTGSPVGGLAGWNNGPISSSHASGDVNGVQWVGGLVGSNNGAGGVNRISGSTASGAVTGTGDYVGGLAGWNDGPISGSRATGNVNGHSYVGGLVGTNYDEGNDYGEVVGLNAIRGSTASGTVTGTDDVVGGLVGYNEGPISDSDARGSLVLGYSSVGGLVGWNNGPISGSRARGGVQGLVESGGLVGWNSSSITDSSASGDVVEPPFSTGLTSGGLVGLNDNGAVMRSNATGNVTGTSEIGGLVGRNVEGTITESVASGAVTGDDLVGGLVGHDRGVSSGDSISASRASGNVIGSGERVGGLVGQLDGTIRTSYATGAVTGAVKVGGLVGRLVGATIASYASGGVSGSGDAVGGLVGQSDSGNSFTPTASSVVASYATGSVSGDATATNLGGLIGVAQAPTGTFSSPSFTDSYWDTERSSRSIGVGSDDVDADGSIGIGETATSGVTGQTTSALQTPTGYTGIYANWNIDNGDPWDFGGGTDDPELRVPPNDLPAFSSTAVLLTVAEDAAVGSNVGAAVTATDSDTMTYKLVGAGGAAFDIGSATGQLQVGAALDHETDGSYTVTVQASDGKSVAFKEVTVTVTGVNEPPALSGDAAPAVADSGAGFVSTYTVADPEGDAVGALTWSLAGADSSYFTIEDGRLSFRATPDYEDPNHGADYAVTVQAAVAGQSSPLTLAVTATVVNVDDAGVVSLSAAQPEEGVALTATLSDPDGGVSGLTWSWSRATSKNGAWTVISGETSDTYTPASGDADHYLRATASYSDVQGSGKSAQGISDNRLAMAVSGVIVTPTSLTIGEGGSGTYTVVLDTAPTAVVTVTISSDSPDVTLNKSSLTFTTVNYATNQRITVTAGQDADAADGTANLTHSPSGGDYGSGQNKTFVVTVTDDDTAGLMLSAMTLGVDEAGQNTYTVKLQTQPTTTVTVTASSGDTGAATVSGSTLIFTASNWETEQTVTVEGVDDGDSANETVTVTNTASGGEYEGVTASVRVTVDDDDKPGITFTPASLTVGEGGVGTYGVRLNAAPTADVTVAIRSSNPDVTVTPNSLTFTSSDWETEQTVDVTASQDADAADDTANLTHRPSGGGYGSGQNKTFVVTVTDDETAGVTVTPTFLTLTEGGMDTYTVVLDTQPTATVTVTVRSDDTGAATVSGSTLRFTTSNWDTAQTVTVTGVNDVDLINEVVTVTNTASGGEYAGVTASVTVTVEDTGMNPPPPPPPPPVVGGGFGPALEAPQFVDGFRTSRPLDVTARAGDAVGDPVAATHPNDDDVTYSLSGANAALFTVDEETGQLRLALRATLEVGQTYPVNLTATDSSGTGAIIIVVIEVAEGVGDPYDLNRNGMIEKDEVLDAVSDYFSGLIEKDEVLALVTRYFAA